MNKYAVWKLKGIDGPNTGPVKVVGVATGDEIETGVVVEGEEATTGAEVVTIAVTTAKNGGRGEDVSFSNLAFFPSHLML